MHAYLDEKKSFLCKIASLESELAKIQDCVKKMNAGSEKLHQMIDAQKICGDRSGIGYEEDTRNVVKLVQTVQAKTSTLKPKATPQPKG